MNAPHVPTPFAVTMLDGTVEKFSIKPLTITQLYQWLYLAKDQGEPAMVALCLGKDPQWVDQIEIESFSKLAAKCHELNFPLAVTLAKGGARVAAVLVAPLMQKWLLANQVIAALSLGSGTPPPTPPPSVPAVATPPA